ncbi:MAG: 50S ribosomal protein L11 [Candidatus Jordarchaeum sp.]|uniref:50S ribosomal protein L11 n=1 Tax=Candidatus Jordarchaeum sp. TaxID=2823881 RepID=UPI004049D6EF
MVQKVSVQALVDGGKASAGPPLGPALGPTGVNLYQVVQKINELTANFKGLKVPVTVIVNPDDKTFEVEVGLPPTSALILSELGAEKGSKEPSKSMIGNLSMESVVKIAKMKRDALLANSLKRAVRTVLGTCLSLGVTVEGKEPREVQKEVLEGVYSELLSKE